MKVDVITTEKAKISKWRWWSNWIDIAVFDYGGYGYLLQMKVSRTNSKRFRSLAMKGVSSPAHATIKDVGDLLPMTDKCGELL